MRALSICLRTSNIPLRQDYVCLGLNNGPYGNWSVATNPCSNHLRFSALSISKCSHLVMSNTSFVCLQVTSLCMFFKFGLVSLYDLKVIPNMKLPCIIRHSVICNCARDFDCINVPDCANYDIYGISGVMP